MRLNSRKLPDPIDFPVCYCARTVRMSFYSYFLQLIVRMLLMGDSHLVVSQDLRFADLLPLRHSDEMLCLDARGAQKVRMGDHGDEIGGGHIFPELIDEGPIVDL